MKLDRNQLLAVILILALIVNSWIHYTHPAYEYYRSNVQQFRHDYDAFRRQLINDFLPVITNRLSRVNTVTNYIQSVDSSRSGSDSKSEPPREEKPNLRFRRYQTIQGVDYVMLGDHYYTRGDLILGMVLSDISPDVVRLGGFYYEVAQ